MRAVVDTSGWVSAVLSRGGRSAKLIEHLNARRFLPIASAPLLGEMDDVLRRPELVRSGPSRVATSQLLNTIRQEAEFVEIPQTLTLCRDIKDDMVIETTVEGNADVIVSEDKDLTDDLSVAEFLRHFGIRVLTLAQFLDELEGTS